MLVSKIKAIKNGRVIMKDAVRPGTVEVGKTLFWHGREGDVVSVNGNKIVLDIDGEKYTVNAADCENGTTGDSKTKDESLDETIRKMAREKADVPLNDDGTIRTPQQAQLAYEQWYKIIKSRYKNDSRYADSKTNDSYFAKGDKITANVSVQGMTEGNVYTVIELDHGKWGTVGYKLQDESGKTLWVNNLPMLATKDSKTKDGKIGFKNE